MEWSYFHSYRKLAENGKVKFLQCPDCSATLVTMGDEDNNPVLWCSHCDSTIRPGLDLYDQIRAVVREHNVEEKDVAEPSPE